MIRVVVDDLLIGCGATRLAGPKAGSVPRVACPDPLVRLLVPS